MLSLYSKWQCSFKWFIRRRASFIKIWLRFRLSVSFPYYAAHIWSSSWIQFLLAKSLVRILHFRRTTLILFCGNGCVIRGSFAMKVHIDSALVESNQRDSVLIASGASRTSQRDRRQVRKCLMDFDWNECNPNTRAGWSIFSTDYNSSQGKKEPPVLKRFPSLTMIMITNGKENVHCMSRSSIQHLSCLGWFHLHFFVASRQ